MPDAALDLDAFYALFGLTNPDAPVEEPPPPEFDNTYYFYSYDTTQPTSELSQTETGGNDLFIGEYIYDVTVYGDSYDMYDHSTGGNDTFFGGYNDNGWFDWWAGGADQTIFGDAYEMYDSSHGGNDLIQAGPTGGEVASAEYNGYGYINNYLYGDSYYMYDQSVGGNDTIISGNTDGWDSDNDNELYGDAYYMYDFSQGGNDHLMGNENTDVYLAGDADDMYDFSAGGNDTLEGSNTVAWYGDYSSTTWADGDAYTMYDNSTGGNDVITGGSVYAGNEGSAYGTLYATGDAEYFYDYAQGGNDTITGGSATTGENGGDYYGEAYATNIMAGDAFYMYDASVGGDDVLVGGDAGTAPSEDAQEAQAEVSDGYAFVMNAMSGDAFLAEDGDTYIVDDQLYTEMPSFGNDHITGGNAYDGYAVNIIAGDLMSEGPWNFDDSNPDDNSIESFSSLLVGPGPGIESTGPSAESVPDTHWTFGDDTIVGGNGSMDGYDILAQGPGPGPYGLALNMLVGDAMSMEYGDTGGNDMITGGNGAINFMVGDGYSVNESVGGDDVLVSGHGGVNMMVGDWLYDGSDGLSVHGHDTFVVMPDSLTYIMDFDGSKDTLDVSHTGITNLVDLVVGGHATEVEGSTFIFFGDSVDTENPEDAVILVGVSLEALLASHAIVLAS